MKIPDKIIKQARAEARAHIKSGVETNVLIDVELPETLTYALYVFKDESDWEAHLYPIVGVDSEWHNDFDNPVAIEL